MSEEIKENKEKKRARTIYLTDSINNAINTVQKESNLGLSKNAILINCIVEGLRTLYGIRLK